MNPGWSRHWQKSFRLIVTDVAGVESSAATAATSHKSGLNYLIHDDTMLPLYQITR